ncbi:MAG: intradiol ring-cleavage dioxygenase [Gammaproteobacteria bacterium]
MHSFNEYNSAELVLERIKNCSDARLKEVMTSIIRHLHAVVKEVEPTPAEWFAAIQFLTATGQKCDAKRQEYILLSDTLGVSMLVDAINNRKPSGATESTVLGPFYVQGAAVLSHGANISKDGKGEPLLVSGRVLSADGTPIAGATLDVWQTSADGFYDIQDPNQPEGNLRGKFVTDAQGRFHFQTVKPVSYPIPTDGPVGKLLTALGRHPYRPAHIHFIIGAPGYESVTTHLFVSGDAYLESDAVFGVKDSLIVDATQHIDPMEIKARGLSGPFYTMQYDFGLAPIKKAEAA